MTEINRKSFIGMSRRDLEEYSVRRILEHGMNGHTVKDGIEREMSDAVQEGTAHRSEGIFVPFDVLFARNRAKRDMSVGTFGSGGAMVETSVKNSIVDLLRNRMATRRLGVQVLDGLSSSCALPRQTAASTLLSLPEQGAAGNSTPAFDQVLLNPHRIGAQVSYSRQLALQSSVSIEDFLRNDLLKQLALKWDYLILQGNGSGSEPCGILNTTGIGSLNFGGTATWAEVVAFEQALAQANADFGKLAFITSPAVRSKWKTILKTGTGVSSVLANSQNFLWNDTPNQWGDNSGDGSINGYRAASTNQVLNNLVFYGDWESTILALWNSGADLLVNPYSKAESGTVQITLNSFCDVAVLHGASYCVSADAGNQ